MKHFFGFFTMVLFFTVIATQVAHGQYADSIYFRFATENEARALVSAEDAFTMGWSEFDIVSRLQDTRGTRSDLVALKQNEVREWSEQERKLILDDMAELNRIMRKEGYCLPLPEEVILVKSTMKDEGEAGGYTQSNWIALSEPYMEIADEGRRRALLLHELSHILTRNSFEYKERLYASLGFKVVPEGLEYPEELAKVRISNPDIDKYDSYGPFRINGKEENCAMYLYADKPYTGGRFFEYVKIAFVPYDAQMKPKRDADGKLIMYDMSEIEDFFERVGKNTNYIIHPEEILAENFVLAFLNTPGVPTPDLQQRVRKVLLGE